MAPHRFVQMNNYFPKGPRSSWQNGTRTVTFLTNNRNIGWQEPRIFSEDWHNSSTPIRNRFYPEEENDFYANNNTNYSPQRFINRFQQQNIEPQFGIKLNNFQRGRNNRNFQDYGRRDFNNQQFKPAPLIPHGNNYTDFEYGNNTENGQAFYQNNSPFQNNNQSFFKTEQNNDFYGHDNFESNYGNNNQQNSYFDEDEIVTRDDSTNSNWFSFENETNVKDNYSKRGGRGKRGKNLRNNIIRRNFKNNKKHKSAFKRMINKNKRNNGQKKRIKSHFDFILEGFEIKPNQIKQNTTTNQFTDLKCNEEFLIIDQTGTTAQNNDNFDNFDDILNSDSNEVNEADVKNNENSTEEINSEDRKTFFCELCNVYCLSAKNFETHNQSNNHLLKMGSLKDTNVKEDSDKPNIQIFDVDLSEDDCIQIEDNNISIDDDVVEIANVDGVVKSEIDGKWDPDTLFGKQYVVQFTGYFCKVCKKIFKTTERASNHCRSLGHFEKCKSLVVKVEKE